LGLFVACGLLVSSSLIVRSAGGRSAERYCLAYGVISFRKVELDGRRFSIGHASQEAELQSDCLHYAGPVIQPNCAIWDREGPGGMHAVRTGTVEPFYTDGTCDGSGGGTRLASAPVEIVDATLHPGN
jgi:hypothetical protein